MGKQAGLQQEERPELGQICSKALEGRQGLSVRPGLESPGMWPTHTPSQPPTVAGGQPAEC